MVFADPQAPTRPPGIALEYAQRLRDLLGSSVVELLLFGSYARGQAHEQSDVDIIVVLDDGAGDGRRKAQDLAADLSVEAGIVIAPVVFDETTWRRRIQQQHRLSTNARREGIVL